MVRYMKIARHIKTFKIRVMNFRSAEKHVICSFAYLQHSSLLARLCWLAFFRLSAVDKVINFKSEGRKFIRLNEKFASLKFSLIDVRAPVLKMCYHIPSICKIFERIEKKMSQLLCYALELIVERVDCPVTFGTCNHQNM